MDLATSEMKVHNEIPVPVPATILVNERLLRRVAQKSLIGYSDFSMCFVSTLNVTNMRATSHQVLLENR